MRKYSIEQLKDSFRKTYNKEPTEQELDTFIQYLELIGKS